MKKRIVGFYDSDDENNDEVFPDSDDLQIPNIKSTLGFSKEIAPMIEQQAAVLNTNEVLIDQIAEYYSHMTEQNHKIYALENRVKDLERENKNLIGFIRNAIYQQFTRNVEKSSSSYSSSSDDSSTGSIMNQEGTSMNEGYHSSCNVKELVKTFESKQN